MRLPEPADPFLRLARTMAGAAAAYHRAGLEGPDLPRGAALLVGNHGLFGFETPIFFWLLQRKTGRFPIGLADKVVFSKPRIRAALERLGGVIGTRDNALAALRENQLVVCYPGGSREVFKDRHERYRLRWESTCGFARIAIQAQVPVVPFAGLGVDDTYINLGHLRSLRRRLGRYSAPVAVGLGPLPLPVRLRFVLGRALHPPAREDYAPLFKERVQREVERLLALRTAEDHAGLAPEPAAAVP